MIALVGLIIGFLSSTVPHLINLFKDSKDKAHELAIMDKQMDMQLKMQQFGGMQKLQEIGLYADMAETDAVHRPQQITGIWIIDFLNGSVRPVITYVWMGAYIMVKYAQWQILKAIQVTDAWGLVLQLWGAEDQAIFGTVLGYWFGNRAMGKFKEK